ARGHWGCELWCRRARGGAARPHPMEHEAQPHKSDQHQLVEKETRDHGKTPSYRWRNEGILPGFQTVGISRKLEVHGPLCALPRGLVALGVPPERLGALGQAATYCI